MAPRLTGVLLLLVLLSACGASRVVRLEMGQGQTLIRIPRTGESRPVEWEEAEFTKAMAQEVWQQKPSAHPENAARELLDVPPRSGWYGYSESEGVVALEGQTPASQWAAVDVRLTREYLLLCASLGRPGDCRKVLMNSPVLTGDGRYALAMSFALEEVIPEMMDAFKGMADPEAIKASILWTMTLYAAMWMAPDPVFSKGLATVVTASFICYVGVDTFWTLIQGWRRLVEVADLATSLSELREAGKKYGKVMGKNAARAFALLLTAAIGQTATSFSAKMPTLPGAARASAVGAGQTGIQLTQVAQVEAVAVTADAVTIVLASNAVASTAAQSVLGAASSPVDAEGPEHHIATDKWDKATHGNGPWTPRFRELFARAGMSLNDPANKVRVRGHKGPHPEEYHQEIFDRLSEAMQGCRNVQQCGEALTGALQRLGRLISTPGTKLNRLVTEGASR
jgi:hypothetical protein